MVFPLSSAAEKARVRPSGESAGSPPTRVEWNRTLPGCVISAVMAGVGIRATRHETTLTMAARRKMMAKVPYSNSRLRPWAAFPTVAVTGIPPASAIHLSLLARSLVFCHRFSGSLARHLSSTLSSAGGVSGCRSLTGTGFFYPILALTTANWLLPSKDLVPVSIS